VSPNYALINIQHWPTYGLPASKGGGIFVDRREQQYNERGRVNHPAKSEIEKYLAF
jgi:hypothetical protein